MDMLKLLQLLLLPQSFSSARKPSETLALAIMCAAAAGIPELRHIALKLRHGFLCLLVKPIELESSQSTPTSLAY
jgi:hypothetical protein